jgi:hypothetical protein
MREQIANCSCSYNLLAYEAHTLKKQNDESQAQTQIILNILCVFLVFYLYKLELCKKARRPISHAWVPLTQLFSGWERCWT